jgi:hypothetical protein
MKVFLCRLISYLLVFSLTGLPFTTQAALIGTDEVVRQVQSQSDRDRVQELVARADVQQTLQAYGVNPQLAQERVDALTDMEIQQIAGKLDSMPAGAIGTGETVLLAVLLVIVIYIVLKYLYE